MNRVSSEIAIEIRVLFRDDDIDAGASEEVAQHHSGWTAADDGTPGGDQFHASVGWYDVFFETATLLQRRSMTAVVVNYLRRS